MKARFFKFNDIVIGNAPPFLLKSVSGTDTGQATRQSVTYIDTDGATFSQTQYTERTVTIEGTIISDNEFEMVRLKRKLIKACELKKTFRLNYFNRLDEFHADAFCEELPIFEKRIACCVPFSLTFTLPNFYWESNPREINVQSLHDEIVDDFTLPCVFTSMVVDGRAMNTGDVQTYPLIKIKRISAVPTGTTETNVIFTCNGRTLELQTPMEQYQTITIDCKNRTITKELSGTVANGINLLTLTSDFFEMPQGEVEISCNKSEGYDIKVEAINLYIGV